MWATQLRGHVLGGSGPVPALAGIESCVVVEIRDARGSVCTHPGLHRLVDASAVGQKSGSLQWRTVDAKRGPGTVGVLFTPLVAEPVECTVLINGPPHGFEFVELPEGGRPVLTEASRPVALRLTARDEHGNACRGGFDASGLLAALHREGEARPLLAAAGAPARRAGRRGRAWRCGRAGTASTTSWRRCSARGATSSAPSSRAAPPPTGPPAPRPPRAGGAPAVRAAGGADPGGPEARPGVVATGLAGRPCAVLIQLRDAFGNVADMGYEEQELTADAAVAGAAGTAAQGEVRGAGLDAPDAEHTAVSLGGEGAGVAGGLHELRVVVRDRHRNVRAGLGDALSLALEGPGRALDLRTSPSDEAGVHVARFRVEAAGRYVARLTVAGEDVSGPAGLPFDVAPAPVDPLRCSVGRDFVGDSLHVGTTVSFLVTARDRFGSVRGAGGEDLGRFAAVLSLDGRRCPGGELRAAPGPEPALRAAVVLHRSGDYRFEVFMRRDGAPVDRGELERLLDAGPEAAPDPSPGNSSVGGNSTGGGGPLSALKALLRRGVPTAAAAAPVPSETTALRAAGRARALGWAPPGYLQIGGSPVSWEVRPGIVTPSKCRLLNCRRKQSLSTSLAEYECGVLLADQFGNAMVPGAIDVPFVELYGAGLAWPTVREVGPARRGEFLVTLRPAAMAPGLYRMAVFVRGEEIPDSPVDLLLEAEARPSDILRREEEARRRGKAPPPPAAPFAPTALLVTPSLPDPALENGIPFPEARPRPRPPPPARSSAHPSPSQYVPPAPARGGRPGSALSARPGSAVSSNSGRPLSSLSFLSRPETALSRPESALSDASLPPLSRAPRPLTAASPEPSAAPSPPPEEGPSPAPGPRLGASQSAPALSITPSAPPWPGGEEVREELLSVLVPVGLILRPTVLLLLVENSGFGGDDAWGELQEAVMAVVRALQAAPHVQLCVVVYGAERAMGLPFPTQALASALASMPPGVFGAGACLHDAFERAGDMFNRLAAALGRDELEREPWEVHVALLSSVGHSCAAHATPVEAFQELRSFLRQRGPVRVVGHAVAVGSYFDLEWTQRLRATLGSEPGLMLCPPFRSSSGGGGGGGGVPAPAGGVLGERCADLASGAPAPPPASSPARRRSRGRSDCDGMAAYDVEVTLPSPYPGPEGAEAPPLVRRAVGVGYADGADAVQATLLVPVAAGDEAVSGRLRLLARGAEGPRAVFEGGFTAGRLRVEAAGGDRLFGLALGEALAARFLAAVSDAVIATRGGASVRRGWAAGAATVEAALGRLLGRDWPEVAASLGRQVRRVRRLLETRRGDGRRMHNVALEVVYGYQIERHRLRQALLRKALSLTARRGTETARGPRTARPSAYT
eukprot:tig00000615_g2541.t1